MAEDKKDEFKELPRDLATLEGVLWHQFSVAVHHQSQYNNPANSGSGGYGPPQNFVIENRKAIAELGTAIVAVMRERREQPNAKDADRDLPLPPCSL